MRETPLLHSRISTRVSTIFVIVMWEVGDTIYTGQRAFATRNGDGSELSWWDSIPNTESTPSRSSLLTTSRDPPSQLWGSGFQTMCSRTSRNSLKACLNSNRRSIMVDKIPGKTSHPTMHSKRWNVASVLRCILCSHRSTQVDLDSCPRKSLRILCHMQNFHGKCAAALTLNNTDWCWETIQFGAVVLSFFFGMQDSVCRVPTCYPDHDQTSTWGRDWGNGTTMQRETVQLTDV